MPGQAALGSAPAREMKLQDVLRNVPATSPAATENPVIRSVVCHSGKAQPGAIFFALHGAKADGNAYIGDAVVRGAVAIASEQARPASVPPSVAWLQVHEPRKALAIAAANFYGHPG